MIRVEEETTSRLDTYLAEKLELSRSKIQKLIKDKKVVEVEDKTPEKNIHKIFADI